MTTIPLDEAKVQDFVMTAVGELGATLNAALVVIGDRLGLYKAMAGAGALTPRELADRTQTSERYVREWLNAQAAGGYVTYEDGRYTLPAEPATDRLLARIAPSDLEALSGHWASTPRGDRGPKAQRLSHYQWRDHLAGRLV